MAKRKKKAKGKPVARSTMSLRAIAWAISEWSKQFLTADDKFRFPTPYDRREFELRLTVLMVLVHKRFDELSEFDVGMVDLMFTLTMGYRQREVWQHARRQSSGRWLSPLLRAHNLEILPDSAGVMNNVLRILSVNAFNGQLDGDPKAKQVLFDVLERLTGEIGPEYAKIHPPEKDVNWDLVGPQLLEQANSVKQQLDSINAAAYGNAGESVGRQSQVVDAARSDAPNVFRLDGDVWQLSFDGHGCHIPRRDAKGLAYIQKLLMNPGEIYPVVQLIELADGDERVRAASSAGEILDEQGRLAMRKRFNSAKEELDKARKNNDPGWIERLEQETSAILQELDRATGLGGRPRFAGDQVDRLRTKVSNAIKRAIKKIHDNKQVRLATHLDKSIKCGRILSYAPESPIEWDF